MERTSVALGLVWGLYMHDVLGSTLVVEAELDSSRAVRRLAEHRIQAIFGVPLIYEVMAKAPEFAEADLSSLLTVTATLTREAAEHPDSCGIGSVFTEIKVVRADGTECDPGETGQILLHGPW
ncbi:MAG: hypothetical protein ACR2G2_16075 [Pseudonocardia sp.]